MNKYITIVELGEDATDFAQIIGIRGFEASRYICDAIDPEGNRIHGQTFTLPKSIEGLPPNNEAIKSDVLPLGNLKKPNAKEPNKLTRRSLVWN